MPVRNCSCDEINTLVLKVTFPCPAAKPYRGRWRAAPLILDLGARWRPVANWRLAAATSEKTPPPLRFRMNETGCFPELVWTLYFNTGRGFSIGYRPAGVSQSVSQSAAEALSQASQLLCCAVQVPASPHSKCGDLFVDISSASPGANKPTSQ
jgi:hypothetical protein